MAYICPISRIFDMKIAILGTRGIPNFHGGFEQFTEYLSEHLTNKGHKVSVYNSHTHPYQDSSWRGVQIIHKKDPENRIGAFGQFIYDFNCIVDSRKRDFDVILQLGYTSSSIWGWLLPKNAIILTNMDGLEWLRSKYSKPVRIFLKYAEKLAIKTSDYIIADSLGIQTYLQKKYQKKATYIAYGASLFNLASEEVLDNYQLDKYNYNMLIARLEPENNIEVILDGVVDSKSEQPFLVIGKHETAFGKYLKNKFEANKNIRFLGGIYNLNHLNNLRHWSNIYFHGHSVGGTNPSLLEAMSSNCFIIAHDNIFNRSILEKDAMYFKSAKEVSAKMKLKKENQRNLIQNNRFKIENQFNWNLINTKYEELILQSMKGTIKNEIQ
jgi:glycosyltransferase involved in cell wall biosynthesis